MTWAGDNGQAFEDGRLVALYLGVFTLVVLASRADEPRPWLTGAAVGLAIVAALGVLSRYEATLFPDQQLLVQLTDTAPRLSYPMNYWNAMGYAMATAVVLLVWIGATGRSARGRAGATVAVSVAILACYMTASRGAVIAGVLGLAVLLALSGARLAKLAVLATGAVVGACLIGLLETSSRISDGRLDAPGAAGDGHRVLALSLVLLAVAAFARLRADRWFVRLLDRRVPLSRRAVRITWGALAVAVVVVVALSHPGSRLDSFTNIPAEASGAKPGFVAGHFLSDSSSGRYQYWASAIDAWESAPWKGIGSGGYEAWWLEHGSFGAPIRSAHSLFLETLAELGPLGLGFMLAFLGLVIVSGWRARRSPGGLDAAAPALAVIAVGLVSVLIDWTNEIPAALLGFTIAAALLTGPAMRPAPAMAPERRFGWGLVTFAAAWVAILCAALALLTNVFVDRSRASTRSGNLAAAVENARRATVVQPWAAAPWVQLGLVYERDKRLGEARSALLSATERAPQDWRTWVVLARVEHEAGLQDDAIASLGTARRLTPRAAIFRTTN
jgi:tetratricopeptide (TPR) repeat protein